MDRITELDKVLFGTTGNLRINAPNKISLMHNLYSGLFYI